MAQVTSHVGNIRRGLARVVLARVTTSVGRAGALAQLLRSRILAVRSVKILFRACGAAHIAVPVGTREVTLATKGLRVPFLSVDVLALSTDRGGRKLCGSRCVGVVQGRLATRDTEGLGATVLRESATMCSRLGSKRVVGNRPGGFADGLLVGLRVVGDLSQLLATVHEKQIKNDNM